MTDKNREAKIIAAVDCPTCGTPIGRPCRIVRGRPMVCPKRKQAWQREREQRPVDYVLTPHHEGPVGSREEYILVAPQSPAALEHLRALNLATTNGWIWIGGALRVPMADMPPLTRRLIDAGWRTAEAI